MQANVVRHPWDEEVQAQGRADSGAAPSKVIAAAHSMQLFLTISVFCRQTAYDKKQEKRKHDREAVAAGTATVEQQNAREVVLRNCRTTATSMTSKPCCAACGT
jgi:hypothetical protein